MHLQTVSLRVSYCDLHDPPVGKRGLAPRLSSAGQKPYNLSVITQKVRSKGQDRPFPAGDTQPTLGFDKSIIPIQTEVSTKTDDTQQT